jgi:peptidyl-prolyl cis-trans isomerase B (cyclophilin B)
MPTASPSPSSSRCGNIEDVPAKTIAEGRTWTGDLILNHGETRDLSTVQKAPRATSVFINLAKKNFRQQGAACHRLTNGATARAHPVRFGRRQGNSAMSASASALLRS